MAGGRSAVIPALLLSASSLTETAPVPRPPKLPVRPVLTLSPSLLALAAPAELFLEIPSTPWRIAPLPAALRAPPPLLFLLNAVYAAALEESRLWRTDGTAAAEPPPLLPVADMAAAEPLPLLPPPLLGLLMCVSVATSMIGVLRLLSGLGGSVLPAAAAAAAAAVLGLNKLLILPLKERRPLNDCRPLNDSRPLNEARRRLKTRGLRGAVKPLGLVGGVRVLGARILFLVLKRPVLGLAQLLLVCAADSLSPRDLKELRDKSKAAATTTGSMSHRCTHSSQSAALSVCYDTGSCNLTCTPLETGSFHPAMPCCAPARSS